MGGHGAQSNNSESLKAVVTLAVALALGARCNEWERCRPMKQFGVEVVALAIAMALGASAAGGEREVGQSM